MSESQDRPVVPAGAPVPRRRPAPPRPEPETAIITEKQPKATVAPRAPRRAAPPPAPPPVPVAPRSPRAARAPKAQAPVAPQSPPPAPVAPEPPKKYGRGRPRKDEPPRPPKPSKKMLTVEEEQAKRMKRVVAGLTQHLPPGERKEVEALCAANPDPQMYMKTGMAMLRLRKNRYLAHYLADCEAAERNAVIAEGLREQAAGAEIDGDVERANSLRMQAAGLERIQPDHDKFQDVMTRMDETERKFAVAAYDLNPNAARLLLMKLVGAEDDGRSFEEPVESVAGMWAASKKDNAHRLSTPYDEEYRKRTSERVEAEDDAEAGAEDAAPAPSPVPGP